MSIPTVVIQVAILVSCENRENLHNWYCLKDARYSITKDITSLSIMAAGRYDKSNRLSLTLAAIAVVAMFLYILFAPNGLLRYYRLQQSLATIRAANEDLQRQNKELRKEIDRLKHDPKYLEEVARQKYGFIKKNELLFNFKKQKDTK